jgi:putative tricarboxylic transport membrane protein
MMDKDKLRKADIFSGGVIMLFGLWIVSQALQMPMKDSWGGVQNVWYVSPALFPLFVGAMIALLGAILVQKALKTVGRRGLMDVLHWLGSSNLVRYLKTPAVFRFYAMVVLFFSFVFLNIPRIDFFLCAILFLIVFITMFYFDDDTLLKKMLYFYLAGTMAFLIFFSFGLSEALEASLPYPGDWLTLAFIIIYCIYVWTLIRNVTPLRKKYRTALILAVAAPFTIGPIFKFFLLVPMPTEGMVVAVLDAIWYWDF